MKELFSAKLAISQLLPNQHKNCALFIPTQTLDPNRG